MFVFALRVVKRKVVTHKLILERGKRLIMNPVNFLN